ncbi:ABC transporter permease [Acinetobacter lwoffii]|uniref:Transport permease protein n=1 Tax=Acinetobacter lwoffii TaxID=28090 RepID=A0AAW8ATK5_ACILW|nr:ABC transporter permease [Acinetobacter lwoffii]MDP1370046.1 ABC transporter permease [Acinetobacter lwoffii]MDP1389497.1 ABC transporter permease [Acinetobacter lwoffii]MDP1447140.1 ABC transporter permease [Acinetobacter lwoffii]
MEPQHQMPLRKLPRLKARGGLQVMYASIRALLLRELQTRFGQYRLGYLWVFLEPLLTIGIMVLLFSTIRQRMAPGIEYEIFLINGIIPFFMFRTGVMLGMSAVDSNKGLFSYRSVKPVDALLARNILEFLLKFIAYICFTVGLIWFGYSISFSSLPQLLGYWILLFVFMLGFSLIFLVVADFSKEIGKIISALFVVLYLTSGILYSIHIIPAEYRVYLLYNPIIHILELMRHAVAPTYQLVTGISLGYFVIWMIVTLFIGLLLYKRFERRMVKSK